MLVAKAMSDILELSPDAQDLLFREARTANAFSDEPVTDEQVAAIYDLVKYGPTAMNNQPLRVLLVRDGEPRERLLKHMADGNRDKTADAPLVAVLAADTDFHEQLPRTFPHFPGARDLFAGDDASREQVARFYATHRAELPSVFRSVRRRRGTWAALREMNRATTAGSVLVDGERVGDVAILGPEGVVDEVRRRSSLSQTGG